ncbi:YqjD family protein [Rhizobium sp. SG2393]|uniref:DUF883 family protein n=1 Tax=Rhizobium sp. SG2393 TaxID=3276279 RepID=UPI00366E38D8
MATGLFSSSSKKHNGAHLQSSIEERIEALRAELSTLTDELADRGQDAGKSIRAKAHVARERAQEGVEDLLETSEAMLRELRRASLRTGREVSKTVRENPLIAVGAAAAFGLIVASLLSSRR